MRLTKAQQAERDEAIERLREIFPAGSKVSVILRHVSRSGMSRSISVIAPERPVKDYPDPWDASYLVARAVGWRMDQMRGGVKVDGCGMDMGFHLVYVLAQTLHDDGYALTCRWL